MISWPEDYSAAWTLAAETSRSGIGLHSGASATVELRPTDQPGFHMRLPEMDQPIQLRPDQVRDSQLCTTLDLGSSKVATVEHLLAALAGCGLSHVEIVINGHEVPLLDGSALEWVEAIASAGLVPAATPRPAAPRLEQPLLRTRGNSVITATPSDRFGVVGIIDFPQAAACGKSMMPTTPKRSDGVAVITLLPRVRNRGCSSRGAAGRGVAAGTNPALAIASTHSRAEPSSSGTSWPLMTISTWLSPQPARAASRCSTVATLLDPRSKVVHNWLSRT